MTTPIAYSYIRFSSQKQLQGDSLRRQLALARKYADTHGLHLDATLTIKDLGVSAYDGSNTERGALSKFLDLVRTGTIPRGSFLLVEQFDRLSRADVFTAFGIFSELVNAGINLVTLADEKVYDSETKLDLGSLMMSIAMMFRSHEESLSKSRRIRAVWQEKRDQNVTFMTSECPSWLKANDDKTGYLTVPERVESVRKLFELTANGYGNVSIVRKANAEKWPVPGRADVWHATLVTKVLRNRATLGEYQPMTKVGGKRIPIGEVRVDFYPRVIDESLFLRAHQAKATRAKLPRRRDKNYMNIFQGVLRCGCCGSSFVRKNKGSQVQPGYVQYLCSKRIIGANTCRSMSGLRLEPTLLRHIFERGFVAVANDDFSEWARDEVVAAEMTLKNEKEKRTRVIAAIEDARTSGALVARLMDLEAAIELAQKDLEQKRSWLDSLGATFEKDEIVADFDEAMRKIKDLSEIDYRASLHERILRVVAGVFVFGDRSAIAVRWRAGDEITAFTIDASGQAVQTDPQTLKLPPTGKNQQSGLSTALLAPFGNKDEAVTE